MNIIQWAKKYQDVSLTELPLTEMDYAFFACASYFDFGRLIKPEDREKLISPTHFKSEADKKILTEKTLEPPHSKAVFENLGFSKRYSHWKISHLHEENLPQKAIQYASMLFTLPGGNYIFAYRGTDLTLFGWEEDFLMTVEDIPAWNLALNDLIKVLSFIPEDAKITVVGHSKGGNLAAFASARLPATLQDRLKAVYDFDGPGFKNRLVDSEGFKRIEKKFIKLIPVDDMIGTLLDDYQGYKVVQAAGIKNGLWEHSLFTWKTGKKGFLRAPAISKTAWAFAKAMDETLDSLSPEEKREFIKKLFTFMDDCGVKELTDVTGKFFQTSKAILNGYKKSEKKDWVDFFKKIQSLMRLYIHYRFSLKTRTLLSS
ncbi:MAG: DUF2974 domain-containing protein [Bacilli bacterium]|jgi:hypothetical protein|nr:DUF2974 domain-containing protein [Bacilli bacterium]